MPDMMAGKGIAGDMLRCAEIINAFIQYSTGLLSTSLISEHSMATMVNAQIESLHGLRWYQLFSSRELVDSGNFRSAEQASPDLATRH